MSSLSTNILLAFGKRNSVSKDNHVLMDLKPQVSVFSKTLTTSLNVGKAIITFKKSCSIQSLKVQAELHFLGLKSSYRRSAENNFQLFHKAE